MKLSPKFIGAALLCGAVLLVSTAGAGESEHKIKVLKVESAGGEPVVMQFSTNQSFADLADGERRTIDAADGESATITRNGDQLHIVTSNGQEVEVPFMAGHNVHVSHDSDEHTEKHVQVIRKHGGEPSSDIMVMAPGGLSDYEKQAMRDALAAAGSDKELHFVGEGIDGEIHIDIETD